MTSRIPALTPPYEAGVEAQLKRMMPPEVEPIGLFRTFVRNVPMAEAMGGWGGYELSRELSVGVRAREIVIDRTCARCGCEYEWGVHVAYFAERAELTAEQVRSLTHGGAEDPCWERTADRLPIELVDQLHDTSDVDDRLWGELAGAFEVGQLLDLLLLCGWYHAISYAARAARVAPETWAPRFADVA